MKKRFLSLLLAVAVLAAMLPSVPAFAYEMWNGTEKSEPVQANNVYQISNGAELAWFADYINSLANAETGLVDVDAVLTDDIYLGGNSWVPISLTSYIIYAYSGMFDGQNHTVYGLNINASQSGYGLFGSVNTATIKNLKVEGEVTSNNVVGGIIGRLQTGTVENCSMSGSVTTTGKSSKGYVGGIIGTVAANDAVITGCCNTADVNGVYAGGILGYNTKKATISGCYNTGDITGTSRSGGIAGQQSSGTISYCYNIGKSINGICGFSNASYINCYYLNDEEIAPGGTASGNKITDKESLLAALNEDPQRRFSEDTAGINNGYPVLTWQLASGVGSVAVKTVNILGNAVTGSVLTAQALGENEEAATNVRYQWAFSADNQNFTDIPEATGGSFEIPDTSDYAGKYLKVTVAGEEESTASAVIGPVEKSETLISKENTEKVHQALSDLTLGTDVIKTAVKLNLVSQIGECSVKWSSSNTDIITDEGVVTLPYKNIVTVMLTASVSCGNVTETKKFNVDVWAADVDADVYLQKVLESMQWNFKSLQPVFGEDTNILVKFKNILKSKGFDGVTVSVKATADESLISQNGKIFYPTVPDGGSFANGRQVQVYFNLTVEDKTVVYPTSNIYSFLVPWDTSDVESALESSADNALNEQILCGDNSSLSSVSYNLNLPSCIDGDRYSFAWITWESSDPAHLFISNENRQSGADSLYNSYVGKIYQDGETHIVSLTASITNPSSDITVTRTFKVTINPLSTEQLEQSVSLMTAVLNCYTADKLTDFATKKKLNSSCVQNDIQLVIPKDVVTSDELKNLNYGEYWDYWNYKFTVSSSDTDVIDVNSFRAYVYRPLGEDSSADKNVTLTVKMESKINTNLYVTKNITVTVKHLSRAEINNALDLMDRAKTDYSKGLLGSNTDEYSIIDNLTPYKEIVWNRDKSGVDFVYRNSEIKNNGIVVDELPGWEDQEDWRLFRTSNKNLVSNETLILNETPAEDTFVKINSVLTDEVFGKYYTKFQNSSGYDAEALAKFKQLYKQPVSAYFMAVGAGNYTAEFAATPSAGKASLYSASLAAFKNKLDKPISVTFTLLGLNGKSLIAKTLENSFTKGATVFDVFKKVLAENGISYASRGSYITTINGLSEFDHGLSSGWMYTVGSIFVNSYMNAQELYGGEDIVVMYVTDYALANTVKDDKNENQNNGQNSDVTDNNSGENSVIGNQQNSSTSVSNGYSGSSPSGEVKKATSSASSPSAKHDTTAPGNDIAGNTAAKGQEAGAGNAANDAVNQENGDAAGSSAEETEKSNAKVFIFIAVILVLLIALLMVMLRKRSNEENNQ